MHCDARVPVGQGRHAASLTASPVFAESVGGVIGGSNLGPAADLRTGVVELKP